MEPRNEPRQFKTGAKKGEDTSGNETLLESSAMSHVQHYHDVGGSVRDVLSDIRLDMTTYSNLHSWDDPMTKTSGSLIRAACRDYMEIVAGSLDFLLAFAHSTEVITANRENHTMSKIASTSSMQENLFFDLVRQEKFL
jgi:hypothetical protein